MPRQEKGFVRMKRGVNATGLCGIAMQASYPTKKAGAAPPLPPPTNGSRPMPPSCPGCTPGNACEAFGMSCCCQAADTLHCQSSTKCCCSDGPCGANAVDAITTVEEP